MSELTLKHASQAGSTATRPAKRRQIERSRSQKLGRVFIYALLGSFVLIYLLPLVVMLLTSFKSMADIRSGTLLSLPEMWVVEGWTKAWSSACTGIECNGLRPYFWNSLQMVIPSVVISTLIGALNGYVLSKWRFRGSQLFFGMLLVGTLIPFQVVLLPMAQTLGQIGNWIGWPGFSNSIPALVMVHVIYGLAFTTLFFRNYYVGVPDELVKAAQLDGAGFFRIFWRIMLPLSVPIIVVSVIWQFTQIWNDFLFGVAFSGPENRPITVALNNIVNTTTGVKEYNVDMAAAIIAGLPTLLVYVLAGKYFVRGLTAGAVKG